MPRTHKDKLLCEAWAIAGVQKKKKSMWFKATTVQRRHIIPLFNYFAQKSTSAVAPSDEGLRGRTCQR